MPSDIVKYEKEKVSDYACLKWRRQLLIYYFLFNSYTIQFLNPASDKNLRFHCPKGISTKRHSTFY